jgi:hypothetical protein
VLAGDVTFLCSPWVFDADRFPEVLVIEPFELPVTVVAKINCVRTLVSPVEPLRDDMMLFDVGC